MDEHIRFSCPKCGQRLKARTEQARGHHFTCPKCGTAIAIPPTASPASMVPPTPPQEQPRSPLASPSFPGAAPSGRTTLLKYAAIVAAGLGGLFILGILILMVIGGRPSTTTEGVQKSGPASAATPHAATASATEQIRLPLKFGVDGCRVTEDCILGLDGSPYTMEADNDKVLYAATVSVTPVGQSHATCVVRRAGNVLKLYADSIPLIPHTVGLRVSSPAADKGKFLIGGGKDGATLGGEVISQTVKAGTRIMPDQQADVFDPSNKLVLGHKPAAGSEQQSTARENPIVDRPAAPASPLTGAASTFLDDTAVAVADLAGEWSASKPDSFHLKTDPEGKGRISAAFTLASGKRSMNVEGPATVIVADGKLALQAGGDSADSRWTWHVQISSDRRSLRLTLQSVPYVLSDLVHAGTVVNLERSVAAAGSPGAASESRKTPGKTSEEDLWEEVKDTGATTEIVVCGDPGGLRLLGPGSVASTIKEGPTGQMQATPWVNAPGSLWIIAAGGANWEGTELAEGRIYAVDKNGKPRLTSGEYSAWLVVGKEPLPLYSNPDGRDPPLATLQPGEKVELLLPANESKGPHKVCVAGGRRAEGYIRGSWERLLFLKRKGDTPAGPNRGQVPFGGVNLQRHDASAPVPAEFRVEPVVEARLQPNPKADQQPARTPGRAPPGSLDLRDPFDTPPQNWPQFSGGLAGRMEVRIRNPNDFKVRVGLRCDGRGSDFIVPASGVRSVHVPNGRYDIYFQYSTDPLSVYQGDSFSLNNNGVEIQIVQVVDGNYGIRKVK